MEAVEYEVKERYFITVLGPKSGEANAPPAPLSLTALNIEDNDHCGNKVIQKNWKMCFFLLSNLCPYIRTHGTLPI